MSSERNGEWQCGAVKEDGVELMTPCEGCLRSRPSCSFVTSHALIRQQHDGVSKKSVKQQEWTAEKLDCPVVLVC